ncbi:MAG TPA: S8 family serine peptidase [Candidatus Sulfomarinibacteraceae bacterium]|nr:S8 family serine peptidase [Candidatus Sulfomarinibacteraceae bacterium]
MNVRQSKRSILALTLLLVGLFAIGSLAIAAPAQIHDVTDDPGTSQEAEQSNYSHRLIVQLESPSLSEIAAVGTVPKTEAGHPNVASPEAQAHVELLQSEQTTFIAEMNRVLPEMSVATFVNEAGQSVDATYQIVFNGVAIDPGEQPTEATIRKLREMSGVKAVYRDYRYEPQLHSSLDLINAPSLWGDLGGREDAGSGVKVASMDGGLHHDAPMFDGTGWTYPTGYPKGDTNNTNGKIIVSRAYFRSWDPPAPGDENTWPGENGTSHGVHTGSIAAGNVVNDAEFAGANVGTLSGVAPGAYVMSYRMFYASVSGDGSFYTVEGIAALEDIVADGADVLNNSWGGGPGSAGGEFDPLDLALINASNAGVFISMSNGNAGPNTGTGDHPSPDYINVAASTTDKAYSVGGLSVSAPEPVPADLEDLPFAVADFGGSLPPGSQYDFGIRTALSVDPANVEGCSPWDGDVFDGVMAVISRGSCNFADKVYYAEQAGATAALVYNNDGEALITMACGGDFCDPGDITIPSFFIGETDGNNIVDWYDTHGDDAEVQLDYVASEVTTTEDVIANFSSRGPGVGNVLKPDIAAPGVNIMAQGYTPAASGEARHLGYGQVSGTSMAAPHVAGAAALVRQAHPTWSNAEIKSALMTTSKFMDIYNQDGSPAQPLDMGAGRLDLENVTDPGVILDPPSLSFGQMISGTVDSITVTVRSVATAQETYALSTLYTGDGFDQTTSLPGFTVSPTSITLDPGESEVITITFDSTDSMGLGDNQGYILLEGDEGHDAHMPAWARVAPPPSGKVLLIDNDFSFLLGFPDYRDYYTEALDELGIPYDVWHADANFGNPATIPPAAILSSYDAIILFTGDNFYPDGSFTVPTPPTAQDMNRLVEYANDSGTLIVMGQDASLVFDDSFFAGSTLGIDMLQDSITQFTLPQMPIIPMNDAPPAFSDIVLDLSGPDTYAGQISMPQHYHSSLPYRAFLPVISGGSGVDLPPAPTGSASFSYDVPSGRLDYSVTISVTESVTLTAAHIHEGGPAESGPVLYPLFSGPQLVTDTFTFEGAVVIDDADEAALLSGALYVNTHTNLRPASAVRGQIYLSPANDGANNQYFIDELSADFGAPDPVPGQAPAYSALFYYPGPYNLEDGAVAIAHREQPTLEWPGISFYGRTIFTGFGLEGVNNSPWTTGRAELLGRFLDWAMDEPEVDIEDLSDEYDGTSPQSLFAADLDSNIPGTYGVSYRWDFGDGSDYTPAYSSNLVSHQYETCGTYTIRVEAVDSWGNHVIGEQEVEITRCIP